MVEEPKKNKVELDGEFYYPNGKIHLYDADSFIANIKHMMADLIEDVEFGIYFGVSEDNCLDVWVRDENGVMYEIEPKQLDDEDNEIKITEKGEDTEDVR